MGFSCGFVGLPNVGKSTIFNALTSAKVAAENFPFCTIEPNTGVVPVPDPRLETLAKMANSQKLVPTQITFVDIAGLIKGASKGEGLGNQFLGHIRSCDAITQVVRCFEDDDIVHVDGTINPLRDIETIETELILSDLDSLQKILIRIEKNAKSGDKLSKIKLDLLKEIVEFLNNGKLAKNYPNIKSEYLDSEVGNLLTAKPVLYVANVEEENANYQPDINGTKAIDKLYKYAQDNNSPLVIISGKVEAEIAELPKEERKDYLESLGLEQSGLDRIILAGYSLLHLVTFFTVGPKEAHAWTCEQGSTAPQAAGKIHSDFEKGFIRAEVISYQDFVDAGSEVKAKEKGKLRVEGKEYLVQDGDIVHFRFNT